MKNKILIIDDEREIALLLAEILKGEGYEVFVVANAWKALEVIPEFQPDLVLSDVMMPVISGLELLKKFRELPSFDKTPVVLMSAAHPKLTQEDNGWTEFVQKPFSLDHMLAVVHKYLR